MNVKTINILRSFLINIQTLLRSEFKHQQNSDKILKALFLNGNQIVSKAFTRKYLLKKMPAKKKPIISRKKLDTVFISKMLKKIKNC